jgi:hypothetical protein
MPSGVRSCFLICEILVEYSEILVEYSEIFPDTGVVREIFYEVSERRALLA